MALTESPSTFDASAVPTNEAEADKLLDHWQSPQEEKQAVREATPEIKPEVPTPEEKAVEQMLTLKWRGKEEQHPISKVLQFAQQGRDYSQRLHDMNLQQAEFATKQKDFETRSADVESKLKQYGEIEGFIKNDPQGPAWWQHVQQTWQSRLQEQNQNAPILKEIDPLKKELADLKEYITSHKQEREQLKAIQEDTQLDEQVESYKAKYNYLDWSTLDGQGKSLEKRILAHAIQKNIHDFTAAANDLLLEEHIKRSQLKAKEDVGKQIKKTHTLGLGSVGNAKASSKPVQNVRAKSWDDIANEALTERGLR